jgi:4-diphosphocytidyl-2-C-methyl-D-erythritol kinase
VAEKFFRTTEKRIGVVVKIKKRIPALAGLGGGSSNGAAVLLALNKYFEEPLKFNELVRMAAEIGKDIPVFLLEHGAVYVSGTGGKLKPIDNFPKLNFLLVNPRGEIGTGWAYQELDKRMWFMEDKRRKNISQNMLKNIKDPEKIGSLLCNDFNSIAIEMFPIISEIKDCLLSFGSLGASMTGKGPTVFGIFRSKKEANDMKRIMKKAYPEFFVEIA